jgi:hypothetical protein
MTCSMGGQCIGHAAEEPGRISLAPLDRRFSHTTTLSNLMFEMAWAEVSASLSRCSSIRIWNASLEPPQA